MIRARIAINTNFPTIKAWSTKEFNNVFSDEITSYEYELPLDLFCNEGGWPDEDSLSVTVNKSREDDGFIIVEFSVSFTELVQTGCSDIKMSESAFGTLECKIDMETGEAVCLTDDYDYDARKLSKCQLVLFDIASR